MNMLCAQHRSGPWEACDKHLYTEGQISTYMKKRMICARAGAMTQAFFHKAISPHFWRERTALFGEDTGDLSCPLFYESLNKIFFFFYSNWIRLKGLLPISKMPKILLRKRKAFKLQLEINGLQMCFKWLRSNAFAKTAFNLIMNKCQQHLPSLEGRREQVNRSLKWKRGHCRRNYRLEWERRM